MDPEALRRDGTAAAGMLREIFVHEMTAAMGTCANSGAVNAVGAWHLYAQAPGLVMRCPACGAVLLRVVHGVAGYWLDMLGLRLL
ncbi:MAG: DUF6510 family protein, partial [Actinomycetota bacterium]|nr:DUF6510 family protein [Actinomycetota bacterium]